MNITESIKFNKLKEENEALKEQLEMAHYFNQNLGKELDKLKQQILYKEDFDVLFEMQYVNGSMLRWANGYNFCFKDNSKYNKLPSKEDE
uniref:Uncharacterized protein n=1 Tax=Spiroplasma citri TaxID=2133 RepID=Q14MJ2_SPICI|nr:hypothetical protein n-terminal truncated [Spiroplasma citri]